jgi:hypothetical protein
MVNVRFLRSTSTKFFFSIGILSFLTIATTLQPFSVLHDNTFEIQKTDWQEDSEKEKEDHRETEDKKLHLQWVDTTPFFNCDKGNYRNVLKAFCSDSFVEILIPPPEFITPFS